MSILSAYHQRPPLTLCPYNLRPLCSILKGQERISVYVIRIRYTTNYIYHIHTNLYTPSPEAFMRWLSTMRIPDIGGFESPTTPRLTLAQDCPGPIIPSPVISRGQRPPLKIAYRRYPASPRQSLISQHILRYTQGIADSIQVYIARASGKNQPTMSMDRSRLIAEKSAPLYSTLQGKIAPI